MARESRDMTPWTFYLGRDAKARIKKLAEQASKTAGRTIRASAVGRALVNLALSNPELVDKAVADAIAEPPSGPSRRPPATE